LAEGVQGNQTLTSLDLSGNKVKGDGIETLIEMVQGNTSLFNLGSGWQHHKGGVDSIDQWAEKRFKEFVSLAEVKLQKNKVLRTVTIPMLLSSATYLGGAEIPVEMKEVIVGCL